MTRLYTIFIYQIWYNNIWNNIQWYNIVDQTAIHVTQQDVLLPSLSTATATEANNYKHIKYKKYTMVKNIKLTFYKKKTHKRSSEDCKNRYLHRNAAGFSWMENPKVNKKTPWPAAAAHRLAECWLTRGPWRCVRGAMWKDDTANKTACVSLR